MPSEQIRRRVSHGAERMYNLVSDIERYPEFVPGCTGMRIVRRETRGPRDHVVAEMNIGYRMISERFTCRVTLDRPALAIDVEFIEGPFEELANHWRFHAAGEGSCDVDFRIDFKLKSRRLGFLVGTLFDRVFMRFVDAFERRADSIRTEQARARPTPA